MHWDDIGYLLSKNRFSENSLLVDFYTLNHGKCSGIIYGGTSRKLKNYLQLGNKFSLNFKSMNINKIGYFKVEIIDPISPFFFEEKNKIISLISSINLIKQLTPELLINKNIFHLFTQFIYNLKKTDGEFIYSYIFWEIDFLRELGFDLNLNKYQNLSGKDTNHMIKINLDNELINVPVFLIDKKANNIDKKIIYFALKFIGNYIDKKILKPNSLNYSRSRIKLENLFK